MNKKKNVSEKTYNCHSMLFHFSLRCDTAAYLAMEHGDESCAPPSGGQEKEAFTYEALMCLSGLCVFLLLKQAAARRRIGSGSAGDWVPSGAIGGLTSVCFNASVCGCVCWCVLCGRGCVCAGLRGGYEGVRLLIFSSGCS